jgi:hypothetical protein
MFINSFEYFRTAWPLANSHPKRKKSSGIFFKAKFFSKVTFLSAVQAQNACSSAVKTLLKTRLS